MPNYSNGKIYCIRSYHTNLLYIGSTIQPLSKRLGGHRSCYKKFLEDKNRDYISSFKILELGDYYIELIENYPCKSKEELFRREGQIQRKTENCVNRCIAGRTSKEFKQLYYQNNKVEIKEKAREHYINNKDKKLEYQKEYYINNKDKIEEYQTEYRENNREKLKDKSKEKYTCKCGVTLCKTSKYRHIKTKKHINFINNQTNNILF